MFICKTKVPTLAMADNQLVLFDEVNPNKSMAVVKHLARKAKPIKGSEVDEEVMPHRGAGFWTLENEVAFAHVKKEEAQKMSVDRNFRMKSGKRRWQWCADELSKKKVEGQSGEQLKRKWANMMTDFRKINDWQRRSGQCSWWDMNLNEKKEAKKLVKPQFEEELWETMNSFLGSKHSINPPYIIDTEGMDTNDPDDYSTRKDTEGSSGKDCKTESGKPEKNEVEVSESPVL